MAPIGHSFVVLYGPRNAILASWFISSFMVSQSLQSLNATQRFLLAR